MLRNVKCGRIFSFLLFLSLKFSYFKIFKLVEKFAIKFEAYEDTLVSEIYTLVTDLKFLKFD